MFTDIKNRGCELTSLKDNFKTSNVIDYAAPAGAKYIVANICDIKKVMTLLDATISLGSLIKGSTGIIFVSNNGNHCRLIYNGITYYETTLFIKNNLNESDLFYIDYLFIKRIINKLPDKLLIYSIVDDSNSNYYIRTNSGDVKLQVISELSKKDLRTPTIGSNYNTINIKKEIKKLEKAYKFLSELSQVSLPSINVNDGTARLIISFAGLEYKSDMPNVTLYKKDISRLLKYFRLIGFPEEVKMKVITVSGCMHILLAYQDTLLAFNTKISKKNNMLKSSKMGYLFSAKVTGRIKDYIQYLMRITTVLPYVEVKITQKNIELYPTISDEPKIKQFKNCLINSICDEQIFKVNLPNLNNIISIIDDNAIMKTYKEFITIEDRDIKFEITVLKG